MLKNYTNHVQLEIHLSSLKLQLMKILEEIEQLIEDELVMKNHNDLEKIENKIVNKTDKLASLILSCKIQESLNTNNELRRESAALISAFPQKMKNQGIREVEICPLKGDPFIIKTEYFRQKEKKDDRKKGGHRLIERRCMQRLSIKRYRICTMLPIHFHDRLHFKLCEMN